MIKKISVWAVSIMLCLPMAISAGNNGGCGCSSNTAYDDTSSTNNKNNDKTKKSNKSGTS